MCWISGETTVEGHFLHGANFGGGEGEEDQLW